MFKKEKVYLWSVERKPGIFETVKAVSLRVQNSGALVFYSREQQFLIAYAPGTWITVFPNEEVVELPVGEDAGGFGDGPVPGAYRDTNEPGPNI